MLLCLIWSAGDVEQRVVCVVVRPEAVFHGDVVDISSIKWKQKRSEDRPLWHTITWAIITTFIGVDEHHETEHRKIRLPAEQEQSQLHARISFLLVS